MNLHRLCMSAGVGFILSLFMLLAVSSAYGQQFTITISPPNPVAGQAMILHVQTGDPTSQSDAFFLDVTCPLPDPGTGTVIPPYGSVVLYVRPDSITKDSAGDFTLTFMGRFPAGTYSVVVENVIANNLLDNQCANFTVSPAPVPEFNGTLFVFVISLIGIYCILKRRHRHPLRPATTE